MRKEFTVQLESQGPEGAWTYLSVPFDVAQEFGGKGRVAVTGTMNGFRFRNSLFPNGNGTHHMMVNRELQKGARAVPVEVVMEPDTAPRTVAVPTDLEVALGSRQEAQAAFEKLAYSHKKAYVDWIEGAKKPETRASRIQKALEMLAEGKRLDR